MKRIFRKVIFLFLALLVACGPLTPTSTVGPTPPDPTSLSIESKPAGPQIVHRSPLQGERLALEAEIRLTFDRDMDQAKTESAWTFSGSDGKPIVGSVHWADRRTFVFAPGKLQPGSTYTGVFSTQAAGADGQTLAEPIRLQFQTSESLAVGQVFPPNGAQDVDLNSTITVIFNRPVVPLTIEEEQPSLPQPLTFTPEIKGSGDWLNSSVYVFQPEELLKSGTTYQVRIGAGLQDTSGSALESDFVATFTTRTPAIDHFSLRGGEQNPPDNIQDVRLDQAFVITFLQPMDPISVEQAVSVVDRERGATLPVRLKWNDARTEVTIQPAERYQIASQYTLKVLKDALSADGAPLREGLTFNFATVLLPSVLWVRPAPDSQASEYDSSLIIHFASPMNFDSTKGKIKISPEPKEMSWYYNEYRWELYGYGLEPDTEYSVRILPGMSDIYGNTIKTEYSYSFRTGNISSYAQMLLPWQPLVYRAEGAQELFLDYVNIESASLSVYSLPTEHFGKLMRGELDMNNYIPQGKALREITPALHPVRNKLSRMRLNLKDADGKPLPPGYYYVGLKGAPLRYPTRFYQGAVFVVATDSLTFKASENEALAWLTDLQTGKPASNVPLVFYDEYFHELGRVKTDRDGLAELQPVLKPYYVRTDTPDHVAFTSLDWGSGVSPADFGLWENYYASVSGDFAYLYTDRPLYRPGQDIYFKGIVRHNDDLRYSLPVYSQVYVTIEHRGERLYAETLPLSEMGSFEGSFRLADEAALGNYDIYVRNTAGSDPFGYVHFRVAEYRKPEYEVRIAADKQNALAGERVNLALDAVYYSGGAVGDAEVSWFMETSPYYFTPSNDFRQFSFIDWNRDASWFPSLSPRGKTLTEGRGRTDENGHLDIPQTATLDEYKTSLQVSFKANVTDVAGNVVSGETSFIVHQSAVYAGIRPEHYVGNAGEEQAFEIVTVDWDSQPLPGQAARVDIVERRWYSVQEQDNYGHLRWVTSVKEIPVKSFSRVVVGEDGTAKVAFTPPNGGVFKATVSVRDAKGNKHQASTYLWVSSDDYISWRQTNDRSFTLVADKDSYSPGETAEILIAQPFQGQVYALLTYERGHIYEKKVVRLDGNSTIYKLPITKEMAPVSYISVIVVSGAENTGSPDFKVAMLKLNVDTGQQELNVKISTDRESAGPREQVTYTVKTTDYLDRPVQAEVSLALVDKSLLALAPPNSQPILSQFYPKKALSVRTSVSIVLTAEDFNANYDEIIPDGEGSGSGGGKGEGGYGIITVRQDFRDTAYWQAQVLTDANGEAQVTVTLPENLTTWHMDARAFTADSLVGQGTHELLSTRPLFVQLQTPRFFVAGDQARVGAVIRNTTEQMLKVDVSLQAKGAEIVSPADQNVEVPARQQVYVTWDLKIPQGVTRLDLTASASGGGYRDASKPSLGTLPGQGIPVYTYAVTETVGTSGILREAGSVSENLVLPTAFAYSDAHVTVELSPSLAASMTAGLDYLKTYPYDCLEQTVSSVLPNVVTARALKDAGLPNLPLQRGLDENVNKALQRIYAKQRYEGGWAWWDDQKSDPLVSAYVVLGLLEAKQSGYTVAEGVLSKGIKYLQKNIPSLQRNDARWQYNRQAFIIWVLRRATDRLPGEANFLYEYRSQLSLYGKAYLAMALHLENPQDERISTLMSDLVSASVMSSSGNHWEEAFYDYWNWNSDVRTTAIILNAFTQIDPQNPLTASAVRWLMAHRESGRWKSTQETAWVLMALTNWLEASGEFETEYAYAVGLNGEKVKADVATRQNLTTPLNLNFALEDLLKDEANRLVVTRGEGPGNLYYTTYMNVDLPVASVQPLDQGMLISRQYFSLADPKTPITQAKRGDLVRVRLTLVLPNAAHYVVINDPLPAGLEPLDATLATDMEVPSSYTRRDYDTRGWGWWYFTHIELRDEKVVLSASYLPAGTYVYTYLARAGTAGTFQVIPPYAFEFYFPDVAGRGAGSIFVVK